MPEKDSGTVRRARPKYQVFISSTWDDLQHVRAKVTWEVLAAGHIPAGMENFPATDDRGWDIIRRTIDRSDYYLIIVAGRYGTYDPKIEMSWTQREYEYARSKGIPVLAFIRERGSVAATELDNDEADRKRLEALILALSATHLKKTWTTQDDLATKVVQALRSHIDTDEEDGKPRPGWYRGDQIPMASSLDEFARLSAENAELKKKVESLAVPPRDNLWLKPGDGIPLSDRKWKTEVLEVNEPNVISFGSLTAMQAFAQRVANTFWVRFAVGNAGSTVAQAVVVDISVDCALAVIPVRHIPPGGQPFEQSDNAHTIAEPPRILPTGASIRIRVKQVNAEDSELLIPVGFTLPAEANSATVHCIAKGQNGGSVSAEFKVLRERQGSKVVTPNELVTIAYQMFR